MDFVDLVSIFCDLCDDRALDVDVDDGTTLFTEEMVMHSRFEVVACLLCGYSECLDDVMGFECFKGVIDSGFGERWVVLFELFVDIVCGGMGAVFIKIFKDDKSLWRNFEVVVL